MKAHISERPIRSPDGVRFGNAVPPGSGPSDLHPGYAERVNEIGKAIIRMSNSGAGNSINLMTVKLGWVFPMLFLVPVVSVAANAAYDPQVVQAITVTRQGLADTVA